MEQRIRVAHILFILLPVFLLANPVYASMGDISICFPFFLLLAALMAAMLAQGKSPLVGFDISTSRPPGEVRSTAYNFKSFGLEAEKDTAAKDRNKTGGGTILTRGAGWVANKATGGKVKAFETMSKRGLLYTVTKGAVAGGSLGHYTRKAEKLGGVKDKESAKYKGTVKGKEEEKRDKVLGKVTSLTNDLNKLKKEQRKGKITPEITAKERALNKAKQELALRESNIKLLNDYIAISESAVKRSEEKLQALIEVGGVKAILKSPAYPVLIGGSVVAGGAKLLTGGAKRKLERSENKRKLNKLNKDVGKLEGKLSKLSSGERKQLDEKKRQIEDLKNKEEKLSRPGVLRGILGFGKPGREAKDFAKASAATVPGVLKEVGLQLMYGAPIVGSLATRHQRSKYKEHLQARYDTTQDHIRQMDYLLGKVAKATSEADKLAMLEDINKLQKQLPKETRRRLHEGQKDLREAHKNVSDDIKELRKFHKGGGVEHLGSDKEKELLAVLKKHIGERKELIEKFVAAELPGTKMRQIDALLDKFANPGTSEDKRAALEAINKLQKQLPGEYKKQIAEQIKEIKTGGGRKAELPDSSEATTKYYKDASATIVSSKLLSYLENAEDTSIIAKGFVRGVGGLGKSVVLRDIESQWENRIGGQLMTAEKEFAKRQKLLKSLGYEPMEADGRIKHGLKATKGWFSEKTGHISLPAKEKRLEAEIKELRGKLHETTDTKQLAKLNRQIEIKKYELIAVGKSISIANMNLPTGAGNVERVANLLLNEEGQLAIRRSEAFDKKEDEFSRRVLPKIEKLDKRIEEYEDKIQLIESSGNKGKDLEKLKAKRDDLSKKRDGLKKSLEDEKERLDAIREKIAGNKSESKLIYDESERVGENRLYIETGLNRTQQELIQLDKDYEKKLINSSKDEVAKQHKVRYKKALENQKGQLERDIATVSAELYLADRLFSEVMDPKTFSKYKEKLDKIQEMREKCPKYAETESKLMEERINLVEKKRAEAETHDWTSQVNELTEHRDKLIKEKEQWDLNAKKSPANTVSLDEVKKAEDDIIRTADMHGLAALLMREENSKKMGGVMMEETRELIKAIRNKYTNDAAFTNEAEKLAKLGDTEADKIRASMSNAYEDKMTDIRAKINKKYGKMSDLDKHSDEFKSKQAEIKELQRELKEIGDDYKSVTPKKEEFTDEAKANRRRALLMLGIGAATVASPFVVLPILGAGAALGVSAGGALTLGADAYMRRGRQLEPGIDRVTQEQIWWGSHFTARGLLYLNTWDQIMQSQMTGTGNLVKGLRLDRYSNIQPDMSKIDLPPVGLPWYIRGFVGSVQGPTSQLAYQVRKMQIARYVGGIDAAKRFIAQNPENRPDIEKMTSAQSGTMLGSPSSFTLPQQADRMLRNPRTSQNLAFDPEARRINLQRGFPYYSDRELHRKNLEKVISRTERWYLDHRK